MCHRAGEANRSVSTDENAVIRGLVDVRQVVLDDMWDNGTVGLGHERVGVRRSLESVSQFHAAVASGKRGGGVIKKDW